MNHHPNADLARELAAEGRLSEAESAIHRGLRHDPNNPDLLCELGLIYCASGREAVPVKFLERIAEAPRGPLLTRIVAEHLHCRKLLDLKLHRRDPMLDQMLVKARRIYQGPLDHLGVRISGCLIVKNEAARLDRCLERLEGLVDETVVVDTGSTDDTLAIAKHHGAVIGQFPWCDDFSAARNHALDLATGDWILSIDADEDLTRASWESLYKAIVRPQMGGYQIEILNFTEDGPDESQFLNTAVRLFRRIDGIRFEGRVHEQVLPSIERLGLGVAKLDGARINHHGYRPAALQKGIPVQASLELAATGADSADDSAQWLALASSLTDAGKFDEAEHAARMCVKFANPGASHLPLAWQLLANSLTEQGRPEEALAACASADSAGAAGLLNEFEKAHALERMGRNEQALAAIDSCMTCGWPEGVPGDQSVLTYGRQMLRGRVLANLGRWPEAAKMFAAVQEAFPDHRAAIAALARCHEQSSRWPEALALYESAASDPGQRLESLLGAARCATASGDVASACRFFEQATEENSDSEEAWTGWLAACEAAGDARGLCEAYERLAARREMPAAMLVNWGRALESQSEFDRALECFTKALKLEPRNPNLHFTCGDLMYKLGQFQDAAQLFEAGLRHAPLNDHGWFAMANALARLGLESGAILAYRQTLALNPGHSAAQQSLRAIEESRRAA